MKTNQIGHVVYEDERGRLHRLDGPAYTITDKLEIWYDHGKKHRIEGPAWIDSDGTKEWYENNQKHRMDGPACIHLPSMSFEWWIHGNDITENVNDWINENSINQNWFEWTDAEKVSFKLRFG